jgi:hypothetical protein
VAPAAAAGKYAHLSRKQWKAEIAQVKAAIRIKERERRNEEREKKRKQKEQENQRRQKEQKTKAEAGRQRRAITKPDVILKTNAGDEVRLPSPDHEVMPDELERWGAHLHETVGADSPARPGETVTRVSVEYPLWIRGKNKPA